MSFVKLTSVQIGNMTRGEVQALLMKAQDEIERLTAENASLKAKFEQREQNEIHAEPFSLQARPTPSSALTKALEELLGKCAQLGRNDTGKTLYSETEVAATIKRQIEDLRESLPKYHEALRASPGGDKDGI